MSEIAPNLTGIRCFIALDISPAVRAKMNEILQRLQKGSMFTGAQPVWVKSESIHLTLHFLGNVAPNIIDKLYPLLDKTAARFPAPQLEIRGLGCFPNERAPKVLWIGIPKYDPSLIALHQSLIPIIRECGIEPDAREYHPHFTLARIKSMRGLRGLMDVIASHQRFDAGACRPHELILFRSDLHPAGAIYSPLHRSPLAPASDS